VTHGRQLGDALVDDTELRHELRSEQVRRLAVRCGLEERLDLRQGEPEPLATADEAELAERAFIEDAVAAPRSGRSAR
jgi:hypothetical protein